MKKFLLFILSGIAVCFFFAPQKANAQTPWNDFVNQYHNTAYGSFVMLGQSITAVSGSDDNAFGSPTNNSIIIEGIGYVIDSAGLSNKGMIFNNNGYVILMGLTLQNFVSTGNGGAIYANATGLTFDGAAFNYNTANTYGGAIMVEGSGGSLTFDGAATFTGNSVNTGAGGAIYGNTGSNITFTQSVAFTSNTAATNGGAIQTWRNFNSFQDNTVFQYNQAGSGGAAAFINYSTTGFSGDNTQFDFNTATNFGGALALEMGSYVTFSGSSASFTNNQAGQYGGAIYVDSSPVYFLTPDISFASNTATYGGAFYLNDGSNLIFRNNANAEFAGNNAAINGGAIYDVGNSTVTFTGANVLFTSNTAVLSGGAIFDLSSYISFSGSVVMFSSNTSSGGGAILANYSNMSFTESTVTFIDNISEYGNGGAIENNGSSIMSSTISFNDSTAIFTGNWAWQYGGAIFNSNVSTMTFANSNVVFSGNAAVVSGGAIFNSYGSTMTFINSNVIFSSNTTSVAGGAIYNYYADMSFSGSSVAFTGNVAASSGGAIYNADGYLSFAPNAGGSVMFAGNTAASGNDIYNDVGGTIDFAGAGSVILNGGIEGAGDINVNSGNVYFAAGSKNNVGGNLNIVGGAVYFATSSVVDILNVSSGTLGVTVGWLAGGQGAGTSFIQTTTTTLTAQSQLYVTTITPAIVGSSTSIMSADYTNGVAFSKNNIIGGDGNGYRFAWTGDDTNGYVGWLIYGSSPWNVFVGQYQNAAAGSSITLGQDITAVLGEDDNPFSNPTGNNFTINGGGHIINSSGLDDKGIILNNNAVTIQNVTFESFVNTGNGGVINNNTASTITFSGSNVSFVGNSAGSAGLAGGGVIYNSNQSIIGFSPLSVNFTSNSSSYIGGAIYNVAGSTVTFSGGNVNFTGNSAEFGGAIYSEYQSFTGFSSPSVNFTSNSAVSEGGAIVSYNYSSMTFSGGNVNFVGNSSENLGGAIYSEYQSFTGFSSLSVKFISNSANNVGGAIFNNGAFISFSADNVIFDSNSSNEGGAITANDAGSAFTGGNITFIENSANSTGGAIENGGSLMDFEESSVNFTSNSAVNYGGAIYNTGSTMTFSRSNLNFFGNNSDVIGGAIDNNAGSAMNFDMSVVNFTSNSAAVNGGAIYNYISTMAFSGGDATFVGNSALNGGAIFNDNPSLISFSSMRVSFVNNSANFGGAINSYANMTFTDDNINFTSNSATNSGGAISNNLASIMTFSGGNATFSGNFGYNEGGAIDNEQSLIGFSSASVNFSNNIAYGGGGAIYNIAGSTATFSGGAAAFGGNYAAFGGAVFNQNSMMAFSSVSVNFTSNRALSGGGAIYNDNNSAITFSGGDATFDGNFAAVGGAIYNLGFINFSDLNSISFDGNGGADRGGAIAVYNATMTFSASLISFTNNYANNDTGSDGYGGAIYANRSNMSFTSGKVLFSNNASAFSGGAIYADVGSNISFSGGAVDFINNLSSNTGGALAISGVSVPYGTAASTVSFNTDGGEVLFRGNMANGSPNDVYMDVDSHLEISGANAIRFEDGIITEASGSGITIDKSGSGAVYLGGDNEIWGDFNITGGDIIMMANAKYTGKALNLGSASSLNMINGTVNTVNVANDFYSSVDLEMEVFANGTNDSITASSATIGGKLSVFAGLGNYQSKEFDLIVTSGSADLFGTFSSTAVINAGSGLTYSINYDSGIVKLIANGMLTTSFGNLPSLSYNQSQTAQAFKQISGNPGQWTSALNAMMLAQSSGDIASVKDFLAQTSGYFLANVVRSITDDNASDAIYDKIKNHAADRETNSGLWIQVAGNLQNFKADDNSLEDFSNSSVGVMFGFDRFLSEQYLGGDVMWGAFARINKDNITQGQDSADGNKNGLGVYGGYMKDNWELKAMLLGSYNTFSTQRAVMSETSNADINAFTISADLEAAIKMAVTDNMKFRPYAGLELANASYGSFNETGAGIYDLNTDGGNYSRSAARIGAGLNYAKSIWLFYANVEGKLIMSGASPEIQSQFSNTDADFYSMGAEEGNMELGIGIGEETNISDNLKLFANAKYYTAQRYDNLYGNVGLRYLFGK